jgi:hypothetical protein
VGVKGMRFLSVFFVFFLAQSCQKKEMAYGEECILPVQRHQPGWLDKPSGLPAPLDVRTLVDSGISLEDRVLQFKEGKHIWTFWDKGFDAMATFQKLNLQTWKKVMGEDWNIHVLGLNWNESDFVLNWIPEESLVPTFWSLNPTVKSDHIRLALLERYGGIWIDATVILLRNLETECNMPWDKKDDRYQMCGFYYEKFGLARFDFLDYFENWLIVARHGSNFLSRWRQQFSKYWSDRTESWDIRTYPDYASYDLDNIGGPEYLNQHVAFRHLLESSPALWEESRTRTARLRADNLAYGHADETLKGSVATFEFFMRHNNAAKADALKRDHVLLKFTGASSLCMRMMSEEQFLSIETTLTQLYKSILYP